MPLSDHSDWKSGGNLIAENFRLKALLTQETREKLEALEMVDRLRRENATLESRVAYFERMIIDLDQLPKPKD